ncbi:hypothetical protein JOD43_002636 [Pullulanibacillus pueri]|uniref:YjzC family protein n=1 Tax=Pullulanibacillus pueri TaxID=1437324 RepID=A0A8J2ZVG7_9BACL|nr:YjzC family protein [Pullulanibacillus pueri]MBM7682459.1 hypothetical protein [Pullulanibacillus pueri]GGH81555.1 hypothetical protein GCM10007096_19620 [Pullulanibacillus pueri]
MGGQHDNKLFHPGEQVPNSGDYREIGEKGTTIETPTTVHLKAGQKFPTAANQDRVWMRVPQPRR